MANETITGKIFTLKDPTGTYNRFPRTVMEAVYGLNTYLQNQFSALADIYMPIEGITESKPLQEFVYRKSPATIKAKSLMLDRIYGKTLAWNFLLKNANFSNTNDWVVYNAGFSVSNNVATITYNTTGDNGIAQDVGAGLYGHKILMKFEVTAITGTWSCGLFRGSSSNLLWSSGTSEQINSTGKYSYIFTPNTALSGDAITYSFGFGRADAVNRTISVKNCVFIDLTLMFGAGNEPSTVEEFESMFPGYHSYEPGKLISNDAESIETVGFNQWDEEWEIGSYDSQGEKQDGGYLIPKNLIPVLPGTAYYSKTPNSAWIREYDANGIYLGVYRYTNTIFTTTNQTYFVTFELYGGSPWTTYNHDICINLSDPAKNGTYEPYRKSVMQLGLGSFQVRDSQGNVTTIEGGLKSAGSVRDEIVGNKYIKRAGSVDMGSLNWGIQGEFFSAGPLPTPNLTTPGMPNAICSQYETIDRSGLSAASVGFTIYGDQVFVKDTNYSDPATFKTAMSGVMLDYELATPIEYELAEPLVPTVKAGTTEARISPNADGLSAPMVADMTYDAQANNDSASAQYALTAGRLLNSHKLWGRDFDGTQDVAGALTGVTSITMDGALSGVTTLGVSGAATLGSTLTVTGLTSIAGGLKLTTTKKIWFDDTHYLELITDGGTQHLHTNLNVVTDGAVVCAASANS